MLKKFLPLALCSSLLTLGCGGGNVSRPGLPSGPSTISGLPLPSTLPEREYQTQLYAFLSSFEYRQKAWPKDKGIRDTGPFKNGKYYGTHPAVKIYYSPDMLRWIALGRKGEVPDGAMMIKEMYPPPAVRYEGAPEPLPTQWTVMVRDKAGSVDGWYWSYYGSDPPQAPDNNDFPFPYPNSGFGLYCVRCHGSAENLLTFASTDNIEGFPGSPIRYEVDDSWKNLGGAVPDPHPNAKEIRDLVQYVATRTKADPSFVNSEWLAQYPQFPAGQASEVEHLLPVSAARVVAKKHNQFMTSDQCLSCHSGDNSPFGPNLIKDNVDVSPHGEWKWSMMGLAGRDPIFYSQLETETRLYARPGTELTPEQIQNLCLHCHGVMGQRQFALDHPGELYTLEKAKEPSNRDYHALSLDGVSCTVCHQIADPTQQSIAEIRTGDFSLTSRTPQGLLSLVGPFPNPAVHPMAQSLGTIPQHQNYVKDSKLCASCHTVYLPVLNTQGKVLDHKYEQATYLEWDNSVYRDGSLLAKSCQDCHMPDSFKGPLGAQKIANVQDQDFPETAHQANVQVPRREGYRRHQLLGINAFALEMFRHFPDILGVRTTSFMTGFDNGLPTAIEGAAELASQHSARVEILQTQQVGDQLTVEVRTTNLAGHRFPSGVGFRRLFMEMVVLDAADQVVWGSGRSNSLGVIVDENSQPLPSEFHQGQAFQPHYQVINAQDQVQIYEELTRDSEGKFTTSFLGRVEEVKDNRLLPAGWTLAGPPGFDPEFAEATAPDASTQQDADFVDGTGSDRLTYQIQLPGGVALPVKVRARLYYQAIPPRYLADRFNQADGPGTRRLHFLTSHLDDSKTPFAGWKLLVGEAQQGVP